MTAAADSTAVIRRETVLSGAINAAISTGFFIGVFGLSGPVPVRGTGNLAFDFLPQSAAVALMSSLVPMMMARRAILAARTTAPTAQQIVMRSVRNAVAAAMLGLLLGALLWTLGPDSLARPAVFVAKVMYGAFLGAFITRSELRRMLG